MSTLLSLMILFISFLYNGEFKSYLYNLNTMKSFILNELMPTVYKFYPIGCSHTEEQPYHGYTEWSKIVSDKINGLVEDRNTPWKQFVSSLKAELGGETVCDASSFHFPSHNIRITITDQETASIHKIRSFCLDFSLLGPYYTCYFEDFYRMHEYASVNQGRPVMETALFSKSILKDEELKIKNRVLEQMETSFPECRFYSHYDLLYSKIHADSIPYHVPVTKNRLLSVYDFLMSPVYCGKDITLLE